MPNENNLRDLPRARGTEKAHEILKEMFRAGRAGVAIVGSVPGDRFRVVSAGSLSNPEFYNRRIGDLPDDLFRIVDSNFLIRATPVGYCKCENDHVVEEQEGVHGSDCREADCDGTYNCNNG